MEAEELKRPQNEGRHGAQDAAWRANPVRWLFDSRYGLRGCLIPRWIFLRALAVIYFSAFYSLLFQIKGLIGPKGILPAYEYLAAVQHAAAAGATQLWYAPSLFWVSSSATALMAVTWLGLAASVLAFVNLWPRLNLFLCFVCFLSFIAVAEDFASYQSDGMLLEAGFLALFLAPRGLMPGWGVKSPPMRASYFLLLWEWFRIYFESGMVKLLSGDEEWRHLTAMDDYYQNLPLPSWIGWYAGHLPHWFQVASAGATLVLEYLVVLMLFLPRRVRIVCFLIVTPWEIGVILTANYAFLNYLVLSLAILLLDDRLLTRFVPQRFRLPVVQEDAVAVGEVRWLGRIREHVRAAGIAAVAVMMCWIAYVTTAEMIGLVVRPSPLPEAPVRALEPFRIANQYGLFAVMTRGRYEIEFQGSQDGQNWTPYLFRYKPQAVNEAPGIYAPYQPRFEWNLWFASLGDWRQNQWVVIVEEQLLKNDADVLGLFRGNPFAQQQPRYVRAVLWQYWFTSMEEKRRTGNWWRRNWMGRYAPTLELTAGGGLSIAAPADELPPHD